MLGFLVNTVANLKLISPIVIIKQKLKYFFDLMIFRNSDFKMRIFIHEIKILGIEVKKCNCSLGYFKETSASHSHFRLRVESNSMFVVCFGNLRSDNCSFVCRMPIDSKLQFSVILVNTDARIETSKISPTVRGAPVLYRIFELLFFREQRNIDYPIKILRGPTFLRSHLGSKDKLECFNSSVDRFNLVKAISLFDENLIFLYHIVK